MPYPNAAYVYAPITGKNWGQDKYCTQTGMPAHKLVWATSGWNLPQDIEGALNGSVRCYPSTNIQSIRTERQDIICSSDPLPWKAGVLVYLYADLAGTQYLGGVMYGHLGSLVNGAFVENRIANGHYKRSTTNLWGLLLGKLPANCNCGCSRGIHIHMQCKNGARRYLSDTTQCQEMIYQGSSWVYVFAAP